MDPIATHTQVNDTMKVVFKNAASMPFSMHPHGVFYDKDNEGAGYGAIPTNGVESLSLLRAWARSSVAPLFGHHRVHEHSTFLSPSRLPPGRTRVLQLAVGKAVPGGGGGGGCGENRTK